MTETVVYREENGVATIAMNRPERRNSFTIEMADGLLEALERAENDRGIRAVVITSTGDHFSVGRDNADTNPPPYPAGDHLRGRTSLMRYTRLVTCMHDMNTPTIAEIRGGCAGAGMSFALNCDFRYASTTAVMSTAFVKVAFGGDLGGVWHLTRLVGPLRAKELLLLSPKLRGTELLDWGTGQRRGTARGTFGEGDGHRYRDRVLLAHGGRSGAAQSASRDQSVPGRLPALEAEQFAVCAASPDSEEARIAFLEKRVPRFAAV